MLNKNVTGRLGNQLFQYAALRAFQEKYARDEPINLDFKDTFHHLDDGFTFELLNFNIQKCHMKRPKCHRIRCQPPVFLCYTVSRQE